MNPAQQQSVDGLSGQTYAPEWQPPYAPCRIPPTPASPAGKWLWVEGSIQTKAPDWIPNNYTAYFNNGVVPASVRTKVKTDWYESQQRAELGFEININGAIYGTIPCRYLLLVPHYLPGGFVPAGTTIFEGDGNIPFGWTPTLGVDPKNTQAIIKFWQTGPVGMSDAEAWKEFYIYTVTTKPVVYWTAVAGQPGMFILTGAGASLGPKPAS